MFVSPLVNLVPIPRRSGPKNMQDIGDGRTIVTSVGDCSLISTFGTRYNSLHLFRMSPLDRSHQQRLHIVRAGVFARIFRFQSG